MTVFISRQRLRYESLALSMREKKKIERNSKISRRKNYSLIEIMVSESLGRKISKPLEIG